MILLADPHGQPYPKPDPTCCTYNYIVSEQATSRSIKGDIWANIAFVLF
jgi:hypothetical protein